MNEDNFNNSNGNDPYEINDGNENTAQSGEQSSPAEPLPDEQSENENATVPAETTSETATEDPVDEATDNPKNEETSQIGSDIIRGHINTIILRALYERDKYGYEIMNDIEQKSHGQYTLKQPTLYSALKRLENQGYIKAYWKTDEVSSGGRRKYFTLTEAGKEITEKNLAEWEYSRTIIDSLISDRSFDFSQPAPTPVDFTLLRNSVSRVPTVRSDEEGRAQSDGSAQTQQATETAQAQQTASTAQTTEAAQTVETAQTSASTQDAQPVNQPVTEAQTEQSTQSTQFSEQNADGQTVAQQPNDGQNTQAVAEQSAPAPNQELAAQEQAQSQPQSAEQAALEEARRRTHENYLRLISEPVRVQEPPKDNVVPNSENVDTERLIYNNRPETERDYKNLIDGIFRRAVSNGSVQTTYTAPKPKPRPAQPEPRVRLVDRGRADGVAVATSQSYETTARYATKTTYNKGATFFKCSAVVLAITAIEFILCFIFLNQLHTTWLYPATILALGLVQFIVFGIMALTGYGKNCVRPTTNTYISSCVILTIISILIISALSFLMNINPSLVSDVMKMIVIPSVTALNITVFAVCFKLLIK